MALRQATPIPPYRSIFPPYLSFRTIFSMVHPIMSTAPSLDTFQLLISTVDERRAERSGAKEKKAPYHWSVSRHETYEVPDHSRLSKRSLSSGNMYHAVSESLSRSNFVDRNICCAYNLYSTVSVICFPSYFQIMIVDLVALNTYPVLRIGTAICWDDTIAKFRNISSATNDTINQNTSSSDSSVGIRWKFTSNSSLSHIFRNWHCDSTSTLLTPLTR